jgi:hypothetical protein
MIDRRGRELVRIEVDNKKARIVSAPFLLQT